MAVVIVAFGIKKNEREKKSMFIYICMNTCFSLSLIVRLFHFYSTDSDNKVNQYEEEK